MENDEPIVLISDMIKELKKLETRYAGPIQTEIRRKLVDIEELLRSWKR